MTSPDKPLTKEEIEAAVAYSRIVVREADASRFNAPRTEQLARALLAVNPIALAHLEMVERVRGRLADVKAWIADYPHPFKVIPVEEMEREARALSWVLEPEKEGP